MILRSGSCQIILSTFFFFLSFGSLTLLEDQISVDNVMCR